MVGQLSAERSQQGVDYRAFKQAGLENGEEKTFNKKTEKKGNQPQKKLSKVASS